MDLSTRDAEAVLDDHLKLRMAGDVEMDIERNYADDVIVLTCSGVWAGKKGVRDQARALAEEVPEGSYEYDAVVVERDVGMLEWRALDGETRICDGVDSYVIRNGLIVAQTVHYTVSSG